MTDDGHGFATEQVHGGFLPDTAHGARVPAIHMSSGFLFDDFEQANERFVQTADGYSYTRVGNPTNTAVERRIADLEQMMRADLEGAELDRDEGWDPESLREEARRTGAPAAAGPWPGP